MLLSVIIPVYNTERFLARCLDSILNQSYSNLEVILIDDGSTDNSLQICREYEHKDSRIRVFSQKNAGQSAARNVGLDAAKGDLISFIDSDDYIGEDTFLSAIKLLEKSPLCDIVQYPVYHGRKDVAAKLVAPSGAPVYRTHDLLEACLLEQRISWIVCDKIIKSQLFANLRFLEGKRYEDNLMLFELLVRSKGLCFSTSGYYFYYWNDQSTTHSTTPKPRLWHDMIDIHKLIYQLVANASPKSSAEAMALYIIVQDMYSSYRSHKWKPNAISDAGIEVIRPIPISRFLFASKLDLRKRLKILGMKVWIYFSSLNK